MEKNLKPVAKKNLLKDTRGANVVEYIILVGVVALIAIAGFKVFGEKVEAKIGDQADAVSGINGAAKQ
jgi:Flp pilus assembly pilin Flp